MSILALNNLGFPLLKKPPASLTQSPGLGSTLNQNLTIARFEDQLVYDDYVLQRIEEIRVRKDEAVKRMEFEEAQKYKSMIDLLEGLGQ